MRVQTVQVVYAAEVVVYAAEVLTEQTLSLPNIQGLFSDQDSKKSRAHAMSQTLL